jgi:hypothetical protein
MFKRLKQLDAGTLIGQLPHTMNFTWLYCFNFVWDNNGYGSTIAALTDENEHPGLMRHVATSYSGGGNSCLLDFVVECADGTVNACFTITVKHSPNLFHPLYVADILLKIITAHVASK